MSICEDCMHYTESTRYCDILKDKRPSLLLSCDYFKTIWEHLLEQKNLESKKNHKSRYNFNCDNKYRKVKMR